MGNRAGAPADDTTSEGGEEDDASNREEGEQNTAFSFYVQDDGHDASFVFPPDATEGVAADNQEHNDDGVFKDLRLDEYSVAADEHKSVDTLSVGTPDGTQAAEEEKTGDEPPAGVSESLDISQLEKDFNGDIEEAAEYGIMISPLKGPAGASSGRDELLGKDDADDEDVGEEEPLLGAAGDGSHSKAATRLNSNGTLTVDTSHTNAIHPALKSIERAKNRMAGLFQRRKSSRTSQKPSTPFVSYK